jgi:autotransporter-associated beta strand protein
VSISGNSVTAGSGGAGGSSNSGSSGTAYAADLFLFQNAQLQFNGVSATTYNYAFAINADYKAPAGQGDAGIVLNAGPTTVIALTGSNNYQGGMTINSGILRISADSPTSCFSSSTCSALGTQNSSLTLNGGTFQAGATFSLASTRAVSTTSTTSTIDTNSFTLTIGNAISGSGSLTKINSGTLILDGQNIYSGPTTISGGTLQIGDGSHSGANAYLSSSSISVATGSALAVYGQTFNSTSNTVTSAGTVQFLGSAGSGASTNFTNTGIFDISSASAGVSVAGLTGTGFVTLGGNTLTIGANTGTIGGMISGTNGGLTYNGGTQTLTLSANNTYSGATTINSGTIALTGSGNIASSAVTDGGTFDISGISGSSTSVGGFSGNGGLTLGAKTLSIGGSTPTTYSGIATGAGGGLTYTGTSSLTLSGVNSYSGTTTINSGGTIALSGSGRITNSAVVDNGAFNISAASGGISVAGFSGSGTTSLGANTLTVTAGTGTYSGVANGTGGLTYSGTGILTLSGINTYSGTTTIGNGGTVALSGTGTITSSAVVDNGAFSISGASGGISVAGFSGSGTTSLGANTLTVTAGTGTYSGAANGTGGLTYSGNGTLTLSGANTYSGITTIASGGAIAVSGSGTISSSSVVDNGAFSIANALGAVSVTGFSGTGTTALGANTLNIGGGTSTYSGVASGTGGLIYSGTGALTLSGVNTYSGNTTIVSGGTLLLSGAGRINNSAVIDNGTFNISGATGGVSVAGFSGRGNTILGSNTLTINDGTSVYSGVASGSGGGLTYSGTGTLTLNGVNTYTGLTTLNSGTLVIGDISNPNASVAGAVQIAAGSSLTGYGTAQSILNSGTFIPGDSINSPAASVSIPGSYTQTSTGTYVVNIDANANASSLTTGGPVSLAGALEIQTKGNPASLDHRYTIITSTGVFTEAAGTAGSVTGTFSSSTSTNALFFTQNVYYFPTEVQIELAYNSAAVLGAAGTPNEQSVANNILATNGNLEINEAIFSFNTPQQLAAFLNQLSGATYANQELVLGQLNREFTDQLSQRIDVYQHCVTQGIRYHNTRRRNVECNDEVVWGSIYGGNNKANTTSDVDGLSTTVYGVNIGAEMPFSRGVVLGAGIGLLDFNGNTVGGESASFSGDLYQFGVYARQQIRQHWRLGFAGNYTWVNNADVSRNIDAANVQLFSNYNTSIYSAQGRVGYRYFGNYMDIQPIAGLLYEVVQGISVTESGSQPGFGLQLRTDSYTSLRSQLGVEFDFDLNVAPLTPFVYTAWEHDFREQQITFNANFIGESVPFLIQGVNFGKNIFVIQAGMEKHFTFWDIAVSYAGRFASGFSENLVVLELGLF